MSRLKILTKESPVKHFTKRAGKYSFSSRWVGDTRLIGKIRDLTAAGRQASVLDIAIGTGKIAQVFQGRVKYVVGVDICKEMVSQARHCADHIILAQAENLPFKNGVFDVCVCRQGLQFMELKAALSEMYRILKPEGLAVLCHLVAYGEKDKEETFLIQELRNAARRNFFLPGDLPRLLKINGFADIESFEYITRESVNLWINNGAVTKYARDKIRKTYLNASDDFKNIHCVEFKKEDILDSMKMVIVRARKELK